MDTKILSENRKALFDYEVLEKYKAGIILTGQEVKSAKLKRMNIAGAFVVLRGEEPFLIGANIPPYQPKNIQGDYNPTKSRKLLLRKPEIKELLGKTRQKGLTLAPLLVYTYKGKIKIEFAIVRGKKKSDKREKIKKREAEREIRRAFKF